MVKTLEHEDTRGTAGKGHGMQSKTATKERQKKKKEIYKERTASPHTNTKDTQTKKEDNTHTHTHTRTHTNTQHLMYIRSCNLSIDTLSGCYTCSVLQMDPNIDIFNKLGNLMEPITGTNNAGSYWGP
jgi:hypothetical protein